MRRHPNWAVVLVVGGFCASVWVVMAGTFWVTQAAADSKIEDPSLVSQKFLGRVGAAQLYWVEAPDSANPGHQVRYHVFISHGGVEAVKIGQE
jgi:hypothetical protein